MSSNACDPSEGSEASKKRLSTYKEMIEYLLAVVTALDAPQYADYDFLIDEHTINCGERAETNKHAISGREYWWYYSQISLFAQDLSKGIAAEEDLKTPASKLKTDIGKMLAVILAELSSEEVEKVEELAQSLRESLLPLGSKFC